MLSTRTDAIPMGRAETAFRDAFDRLKRNKPERIPRGTLVSQNNVAKEAGCDSSALRKSRFPSLVAEIQRWVKEHGSLSAPSSRQKKLAQRNRNRLLETKIEVLKAERDHALTLLVEADRKILELLLENASLQTKISNSKISPRGGTSFLPDLTR